MEKPKYTQRLVFRVYIICYGQEAYVLQIEFRRTYSLIKLLVVQFGMTNARADFQGFINLNIRETLNGVASAYLGDILIYIILEAEHVQQVKWLMQ